MRVLVTGCSSGSGLATALALARRGDDVLAGVRDPAAPRLRAAIAAEGLPVEVVELDVTDDASRRRCVEAAGPLDVLVNNAGIGGRGPVELIEDATLRAVFETNFFAAVALIGLVAPAMRAERRGVIVNVSSVDGRAPGRPLLWAYQASKHAVTVMTEALALELEPFGVRVRLVEPGFFASRIGVNRSAREDAADPPWRRSGAPYAALATEVDRQLAQGRATAVAPEVVAAAIVAACGDPTRIDPEGERWLS
ncbi:MAG: SDR family NAD(P)-dependent oxidoreductase [Actinobacteria bacterium]|nr:SDR family NAD(P)-dependent oxidoreductase [Actinomycetota bacterium]